MIEERGSLDTDRFVRRKNFKVACPCALPASFIMLLYDVPIGMRLESYKSLLMAINEAIKKNTRQYARLLEYYKRANRENESTVQILTKWVC